MKSAGAFRENASGLNQAIKRTESNQKKKKKRKERLNKYA